MGDSLVTLGAAEAVHRIRSGSLTATELVSACLARIGRVDPVLRAWAHLEPESALRQAGAVDAKVRGGRHAAALGGIPVGIKDIFNTVDMPTQMGSPIWSGFTPGNDARVVHSLRMADAVIPGKTVTAEFAVHTPGPTRNPYDPDCMAGTSSTGSAVAVASYMVPIAIGTQTAGSTIRPASYCGIYGFKPSFGLIPRTGMLKTTDSLDTVGLFARTVEDLALLLDTVRVKGPDYPVSDAIINDPERQDKRGRPWRVAVVRGPKWGHAEEYARKALLDLAVRLRDLPGIVVEEAALPASLEMAHDVHSVIYDRTLAYYFKEEFKKRTLISGIMYEIIERGNRITLPEYQEALTAQSKLARDLDSFFAGGPDVILDLSTGGEPLRGLDSPDRPDNCLIWTLCGVPALNLPVFSGPNRLPFGAQVLARRYNDYLLLKFARWLRQGGAIPGTTNPKLPPDMLPNA